MRNFAPTIGVLGLMSVAIHATPGLAVVHPEGKDSIDVEPTDAAEQVSLGEKYENGDGVAENHAEAVRWYRMAAEGGNDYAREKLLELQ